MSSAVVERWRPVIASLEKEHELIERGPYRFARHPIYTGMLEMLRATAIVIGHLGGLIGVILAFDFELLLVTAGRFPYRLRRSD